MQNLNALLIKLNACSEAKTWAETQPDLATAWNNCARADWMLWLAAKIGVDQKLVVLVACDCAETALAHTNNGDVWTAALFTLHVTREWCAGRANLEDARAVQPAAYAAYVAACASADVAACAAAAAVGAAADAAEAAGAAARKKALAELADVVRARASAAQICFATEKV